MPRNSAGWNWRELIEDMIVGINDITYGVQHTEQRWSPAKRERIAEALVGASLNLEAALDEMKRRERRQNGAATEEKREVSV